MGFFFLYFLYNTVLVVSNMHCKNIKTVFVLPCFTGYLNLIPDIFLGLKFDVHIYSTFIAQWKVTFWCQNVTVNVINY